MSFGFQFADTCSRGQWGSKRWKKVEYRTNLMQSSHPINLNCSTQSSDVEEKKISFFFKSLYIDFFCYSKAN